MPASIACAKAGVTTGEWGWTLREAFGEYRAPTGVGNAMRNDVGGLDDIRADVDRVSRKLGRRMTFLVGKPGLDGHSNGAEQIAVRARDAGMQVVYQGIRLTPEEIVDAAREQKAHVVGLSILSGSHLPLVKDVISRLKEAGIDDVPVVVGGIIPPEDAEQLEEGRRRRGLYAEGFRAQPHHVRPGADRRKPGRRPADSAVRSDYARTHTQAGHRSLPRRGEDVMTVEAILIILIVGAVAGWLAGQIVRGMGFGLIGNIVVGIVGAFIAGWLLPRIGIVDRRRHDRDRSSTPRSARWCCW